MGQVIGLLSSSPFFFEFFASSFLAETFGDKREKGRFQKVAKQV
jgi:hypothetical protein